MEFVTVNFSTSRIVRIDGAPRGRTGLLLRVQAGTHTFDLGAPPNYTPSSVMTPVRGTTPASPMVIAFVPLGVSPAAAAPRAARAATDTARKRSTKRAKKKRSVKRARTSGKRRARKPRNR